MPFRRLRNIYDTSGPILDLIYVARDINNRKCCVTEAANGKISEK